MHSENVGELAKALAVAQALIKAPTKGKTAKITGDKGYSYKYADLADVIDCYRDPLSKAGLAVTQTLRVDDGHMVLVTTLLHTSGQWVASEYPLQNYNRPQEQGSAITYARRYSVSSLLGIAAEDDDDGQAAQHAEPVKKEEPRPLEGDAAAVAFLAAELSDLVKIPHETLMKDASAFTDKNGKQVSGFTDPRGKSAKWLAMTKAKLERLLYEEKLKAEPGVEEAAELFK